MKILTDELINNSKFYLNDRTTIEVLKHKLTAEEWKSIENVYHHIPTIEDELFFIELMKIVVERT